MTRRFQDLSRYRNEWSARNKLLRLLWSVTEVIFFRPVPRWFPGWHRAYLRLWGAVIGVGVRVDPSARIWAPWNLEIGDHSWIGPRVDLYCVDRITIGAHAVVSQDASLCSASHDIRDLAFPLITSPIRIADGAWVAARAFVGPGRSIGPGAVVGACAVVTRDVAGNDVVAGNPARVVGQRLADGAGKDAG